MSGMPAQLKACSCCCCCYRRGLRRRPREIERAAERARQPERVCARQSYKVWEHNERARVPSRHSSCALSTSLPEGTQWASADALLLSEYLSVLWQIEHRIAVLQNTHTHSVIVCSFLFRLFFFCASFCYCFRVKQMCLVTVLLFWLLLCGCLFCIFEFHIGLTQFACGGNWEHCANCSLFLGKPDAKVDPLIHTHPHTRAKCVCSSV